MSFTPERLLKSLDPTKKQGGLLLFLNAAGMVFAAASNTFAIVKDKNTKQEDKKILVPAGIATGFANIATYYAITKKIIKNFENNAVKAVGGVIEEQKGVEKTIECPKDFDLANHAKTYAIKQIEKAKKGKFFGLFGKKSKEDIAVMADTFLQSSNNGSVKDLINNNSGNLKDALKDAKPTKYALDSFQSNIKAGASVLGAFTGAVIGCAIITPIIRDISAYFVQKKLEKKQPELSEKPYRPYFDPAHIGQGKYGRASKQPLSMQSYMSFTNGAMKI